MRILISGGGIAGLTLAYWPHHWGHTPVVVERAPHGRLGGYGIDFFGTGYDVAAQSAITRLVLRDAFSGLLRRGFGDTTSILTRT